MKCPLFIMNDTRAQLGEETEIGDCIGDDCAWWLPQAKCCSIASLACDIEGLKDELEDVNKSLDALNMAARDLQE